MHLWTDFIIRYPSFNFRKEEDLHYQYRLAYSMEPTAAAAIASESSLANPTTSSAETQTAAVERMS